MRSGTRPLRSLYGVSLRVEKGASWSFGKSGSGKTTALKTVNRLVCLDAAGPLLVREVTDWAPSRCGGAADTYPLIRPPSHIPSGRNVALVPRSWLA